MFNNSYPSGSCHSAQQLLASSLSFYLRMYICMLTKSQVSEAPHVAQLPLCNWCHYFWAIEEWEANYVANSTVFAWHLTRLAILDLCSEGAWTDTSLARHCEECTSVARLWGQNLRLHSIPGYRIDTKSKKNVFTCTSGCQKRHLTMLAFCCANNRIIISFLCIQIN